MIDMKKKIEDNVELIRNKALSNKFDFFQHDNIKYQEEILKSLAQIENIMYFPVCKVNEYKYFPHISKIEKIINEQKTKFIEVKDDKQKKNCQK